MSVEIRTFVLERDHSGPFHVLPEDAGDFIPPWILECVETIEKEPVLDLLERIFLAYMTDSDMGSTLLSRRKDCWKNTAVWWITQTRGRAEMEVGDVVEVLRGERAGSRGTVIAVSEGGAVVQVCDAGPVRMSRASGWPHRTVSNEPRTVSSGPRCVKCGRRWLGDLDWTSRCCPWPCGGEIALVRERVAA